MAVADIHGIYGVRLYTGDMDDAVILDGVSNQSLTIDSNISRDATSGFVYPRNSFIQGQTFQSSLSTVRINQWLAEIGFTGKAITTDTGKPGIVLYAQKFDASNAGRASGSNHRSYTIADGFIVPTRLTVDHQGDAELMYDLYIVFDGTNDPIVVAESQSLPSLVGDDVRFTLGGCTVANKALSQVRSLEINFNPTVRVESSDSDVYPTFVSVAGWAPSITLRGVKSNWFDDGTNGLDFSGSCTHANTIIWLRKRAQGGANFVANATAEHIKITAAGIAVVETVQQGATGASVESSVRVETKYDGTNAPIVFTLDSAIS